MAVWVELILFGDN